MMSGWMQMTSRLLGSENAVHPVCVAAVVAFGFVFIQPFVDGNGRIHRFLVHTVLSKTKFSPARLVFPVSAAMLRDMTAYDQVLELFSQPISRFITHNVDDQQQISVLNDTADLYRYFDATAQVEYLFDCIEDTISRDLKRELDFLKFFDAAMKDVMNIVDMPNQRAALLIKLIHQNKGKLSTGKREMFQEVSDQEIAKIETAIREAAQRFQATELNLLS